MNKKKAAIRFISGLVVITALLILIVSVLANVFDIPLPSTTYLIFLFFFISMLGVHMAFLLSSEEKGQTSITYFMATIFGKLIISLIFIILLIYFNPEEAYANAILFFSLYLIYTIYELTIIVRFIHSKPGGS